MTVRRHRRRPIHIFDLAHIRGAIFHVQQARELLRRAGAHTAADACARALKSVDGARRHAEGKARREAEAALP